MCSERSGVRGRGEMVVSGLCGCADKLFESVTDCRKDAVLIDISGDAEGVFEATDLGRELECSTLSGSSSRETSSNRLPEPCECIVSGLDFVAVSGREPSDLRELRCCCVVILFDGCIEAGRDPLGV